ncbi:MAG: hypothetical protein OXN44_08275 [Acidimicrobiaceae bacterium]|nr:hypothetical protein [Acidimicrobiaceae bacterium]MDE0605622.1 hypothetical protein [Acidimicrobiaceae bacterium]
MKETTWQLRLAQTVAAAWLIGTATTQTPWRTLDKARDKDFFQNVLPNWRFFAPDPARHDFRVLFRCRLDDGTETPWAALKVSSGRKLIQSIWFPERRESKALTDTAIQIHSVLGSPGFEDSPSYKLLRGRVARAVRESEHGNRCVDLQFLLAKDGGYDFAEAPEYVFVSRLEPYEPAGSAYVGV